MCLSLRPCEAVADATYCQQARRLRRIRLDLLAQVRDVDVAGTDVGHERGLPRVLEDLPPRERAILTCEQREDAQLGRADARGLARDRHLVAQQVELQVTRA